MPVQATNGPFFSSNDVDPLFFDLDTNKDQQTTENSECGFLHCYKHVANVLCGQCGLDGKFVLDRAYVSRRQGNLHIVYKGVDVTYSQHKEVRRRVLELLKEEDPDTKWDEIVDSVRSLRMLGSVKFRQRAGQGKPRGAMIEEGFYAPCEKPSPTSNSFNILDVPIDVDLLLATSLWRPVGTRCHPSILDEDEVAITAVVRERTSSHPSTAQGDVAKLCDLITFCIRRSAELCWHAPNSGARGLDASMTANGRRNALEGITWLKPEGGQCYNIRPNSLCQTWLPHAN